MLLRLEHFGIEKELVGRVFFGLGLTMESSRLSSY